MGRENQFAMFNFGGKLIETIDCLSCVKFPYNARGEQS